MATSKRRWSVSRQRYHGGRWVLIEIRCAAMSKRPCSAQFFSVGPNFAKSKSIDEFSYRHRIVDNGIAAGLCGPGVQRQQGGLGDSVSA